MWRAISPSPRWARTAVGEGILRAKSLRQRYHASGVCRGSGRSIPPCAACRSCAEARRQRCMASTPRMTATHSLRPRHTAERHQRTDARDCEGANTGRDAWGGSLLWCRSQSRIVPTGQGRGSATDNVSTIYRVATHGTREPEAKRYTTVRGPCPHSLASLIDVQAVSTKRIPELNRVTFWVTAASHTCAPAGSAIIRAPAAPQRA
jgi:hypothetical protein